MNDSCVWFLHRANTPSDILSIKLSREYLRLLFPGLAWSSLNSTCGIRPHSGFKGYRLYAETPLSLLWMRCPRSTLVRGAPSRYRLRRLRLRSTAPRYRNSASVSLFISSRVVPVTCFARDVYHVLPYRISCKKFVHELLLQNFAIGSRYLNSYKCTIQLFGRATGGPCNLYSLKRSR